MAAKFVLWTTRELILSPTAQMPRIYAAGISFSANYSSIRA
jgi:hypothetical protein